MDSKMFMPLNISYVQKRNTDRKIVFTLLGLAIFIIGIFITLKIKNDAMFSPILGSSWFAVIELIGWGWLSLFIIRKLAFKEKELMRLYKEMLDHNETVIDDLWEVFAIEDDVAMYYDKSSKVFLKCESGYVVGRQPGHEDIHRERVCAFIEYLTSRGYYVDYYNMGTVDSNTEPLFGLYDSIESRVTHSDNPAIKEYGSALLKECRELEYGCENSKVEYYVISARDSNNAAYLMSTVEASASLLQGSLYSRIHVCDEKGIAKFSEELFHIEGISIENLMQEQSMETSQKLVKFLRVYKDETSNNTPEEDEESRRLREEMNRQYEEDEKFRLALEKEERAKNLATSKKKNIIPILGSGSSATTVKPIIIDDEPEVEIIPEDDINEYNDNQKENEVEFDKTSNVNKIEISEDDEEIDFDDDDDEEIDFD